MTSFKISYPVAY